MKTKNKYNKNGEEIMDPTPTAVPINFKHPPTLADQVKRLVRSEQLRIAAEKMGKDTFEEANDFDVGDDFDPAEELTPHEIQALEGDELAHMIKPPRQRSRFQEEKPEQKTRKKEKKSVEKPSVSDDDEES